MTSPQLARVWVGRYVLMPDHIHIFIATENLRNLSRWVGSLKKYFAAHWRRAGSEGPFWQKGFFDHLLRSEESYQEKWEYVRRNPVRAGLVTHPDEWPFCGEIERLRW
jgi:REP element-mobilizing transposase RayT